MRTARVVVLSTLLIAAITAFMGQWGPATFFLGLAIFFQPMADEEK